MDPSRPRFGGRTTPAGAAAFQSIVRPGSSQAGRSRGGGSGRWMPVRSNSSSQASSARPPPPLPLQRPQQQQQQPQVPVVIAGSKTHILVAPIQKGNPVLQHLTNVPWQYANVLPDYVVGERCAVLYLSVRYHQVHTGRYLQSRLAGVGRLYDLRLVLLHVDLPRGSGGGPVEEAVLEVTKIGMIAGWTVVCAESPAEVARWLEALKKFEPQQDSAASKPLLAIAPVPAGRSSSARSSAGSASSSSVSDSAMPTNERELAVHMLAMIPTVNRTDALNLLRRYGSLRALLRVPLEELQQLRGIGPKKARCIHEAFRQPIKMPLLHSRPEPPPAGVPSQSPAAAWAGSPKAGFGGARQPQQPQSLPVSHPRGNPPLQAAASAASGSSGAAAVSASVAAAPPPPAAQQRQQSDGFDETGLIDDDLLLQLDLDNL